MLLYFLFFNADYFELKIAQSVYHSICSYKNFYNINHFDITVYSLKTIDSIDFFNLYLDNRTVYRDVVSRNSMTKHTLDLRNTKSL